MTVSVSKRFIDECVKDCVRNTSPPKKAFLFGRRRILNLFFFCKKSAVSVDGRSSPGLRRNGNVAARRLSRRAPRAGSDGKRVRPSTGPQYATGRVIRLDGLSPLVQSGRAPQRQLVELGAGHEQELAGPDGGSAAPAERDGQQTARVARGVPVVQLLLWRGRRRRPVVLLGRQPMRLGGHHAHARHVPVVGHANDGALDHCENRRRN